MDRIVPEALPSLPEVSIYGAEVDIRCFVLNQCACPGGCRIGEGPGSSSSRGGLLFSSLLPAQPLFLVAKWPFKSL